MTSKLVLKKKGAAAPNFLRFFGVVPDVQSGRAIGQLPSFLVAAAMADQLVPAHDVEAARSVNSDTINIHSYTSYGAGALAVASVLQHLYTTTWQRESQ